MTSVTGSSQARAVRAYRARLRSEGVARFEVLGLDLDRSMIRSLAKRLAAPGADADRLRFELARLVVGDCDSGGAIVAALRESPLVGADLRFERARGEGRLFEV